MSRQIQQIINQASDTCDVYLYGIIGKWMDIDVNKLIPELENLRKSGVTKFKFYVNSDGGDVIQCQALWNYLNRTDVEVTWIVDGIAASAAYDMMTNPRHKVIMSKYSKILVHKVSGSVYGSSKDIRGYADRMDAFENEIVDMISARCGQDKKTVQKNWFDGTDHWFNATDAVDNKLADAVVDGIEGVNGAPDSLIDPTDIYNYFQNQIINFQNQRSMTHKEIAPILNMDPNSDETAVRAAIQNTVSKATRLEKENGELTAERDRLKNQVDEMNKAKVKNLIDGAITAKKFGEDMRNAYTKMAESDYETAEKVINSLSGVSPIANQLNGGGDSSVPVAEKDWTWDDYHKKGKLENLKSTNLDHFKNLYKSKFNREYAG